MLGDKVNRLFKWMSVKDWPSSVDVMRLDAFEELEQLQQAAKPKVCHIDGCINHDDAFENCCSRYVWVECCVDCTPYSERFKKEKVGD